MRPSSGGDALASTKPTSRKSSIGDRPTAHSVASSNVPTTFFIRSEEEMEDSQAGSPEPDPTSAQRESTYGVESLADTLESAFGQDGNGNEQQPAVPESEPDIVRENRRRTSSLSDRDADERTKRTKLSPRKQNGRFHSSTAPTPSSVSIASPAPNSAAPSTPKSVSLQSLRLSDEEMESGMDDSTSQAIASSGEEEDDLEMEESGSFPQLVMPSIQMPSRRPFTTKGKAMGKLKVLVAGEAGLGKTSLIRSIVQLCEDIVHVDPLSPPLPSPKTSSSPSTKSRKRKAKNSGTARITEIHASTKAYPPWWTDMEDNRGLRRRKSMSDSILERNICFVDTPGIGKASSSMEEMNLTVDYVESLLYRNATVGSMSDGDLLGVISGNGGVQVDLVIYMLSPTEDISKDIQHMQRLSSMTNVIPVIAKADTLPPSDIMSIKTSILARLQTTSIKPFLFGKQIDDALLDVQGVSANMALSQSSDHEPTTPIASGRHSFATPTYPYAICSTAGLESDPMDASLLMASDYLQPLLPSELASLVAQIFDPDSISWLRHSAAKKFLTWRRQMKSSGDSFAMHGLYQNQQNRSPSSSPSMGPNRAALNASGTASILSSPSPSGVLVPRPNSPFYLTNSNFNSNLHSPFAGSSPSLTHTQAEGLEGPTDFSLARYYNQMHREERFAEVRLAKWAADLQRSLRNERDRFEELQRAERAKWLLERVGEEVRDGNILASPTSSATRADWAVVRHGNGKDGGDKLHHRYGRGGAFDSRDPLGLCDFGDEFRRRSFTVVKFLGGMSVVGAVVLTVFRVSGWGAAVNENGVWNWLVGNGE